MWLNLLASFLTLGGYVPYTIGILQHKTRPNRVTWWIWLCVGVLVLTTYHSLGSTAALGMAMGSVIGQAVVAGLSIKYGTGGTTNFDRACLLSALGIAVLWFLTSSAFLPYLLTLSLDVVGWLPTFRKSLRDPGSENLAAWSLWNLSQIVSLLNVQQWTISNALYPLVYFVTNCALIAVLLRHRWRKRA